MLMPKRQLGRVMFTRRSLRLTHSSRGCPRTPMKCDRRPCTPRWCIPKPLTRRDFRFCMPGMGVQDLSRVRSGWAQYRKWMPWDPIRLALIANFFQAVWERSLQHLRRFKTALNTTTTKWLRRQMNTKRQGRNSIL